MLCLLLLLTRVKDGVTNGWLGLSSHAVTVKEVSLFMDPETRWDGKPAARYAVPMPNNTVRTVSYSFLLTRYNTASKLQHISVKLQSDYIHRLVTEHYRPAEDVEHNVDRAQRRSEHDTKMYKGQINHPSFVQQQSDVAEF